MLISYRTYPVGDIMVSYDEPSGQYIIIASRIGKSYTSRFSAMSAPETNVDIEDYLLILTISDRFLQDLQNE